MTDRGRAERAFCVETSGGPCQTVCDELNHNDTKGDKINSVKVGNALNFCTESIGTPLVSKVTEASGNLRSFIRKTYSSPRLRDQGNTESYKKPENLKEDAGMVFSLKDVNDTFKTKSAIGSADGIEVGANSGGFDGKAQPVNGNLSGNDERTISKTQKESDLNSMEKDIKENGSKDLSGEGQNNSLSHFEFSLEEENSDLAKDIMTGLSYRKGDSIVYSSGSSTKSSCDSSSLEKCEGIEQAFITSKGSISKSLPSVSSSTPQQSGPVPVPGNQNQLSSSFSSLSPNLRPVSIPVSMLLPMPSTSSYATTPLIPLLPMVPNWGGSVPGMSVATSISPATTIAHRSSQQSARLTNSPGGSPMKSGCRSPKVVSSTVQMTHVTQAVTNQPLNTPTKTTTSLAVSSTTASTTPTYSTISSTTIPTPPSSPYTFTCSTSSPVKSTKVSSQDTQSMNTLRVDNWGSYLLQRLEALYDREEQCDLTLHFSCGSVLKVHRAVLKACTSLLTDSDVHESQFTMPRTLDFASVEPIIRFVYSGRLDVQGSKKELGNIYTACQKLKVSLLTRLMDRRFPFLTGTKQSSNRLPIWKRNQSQYQQPQTLQPDSKGENSHKSNSRRNQSRNNTQSQLQTAASSSSSIMQPSISVSSASSINTTLSSSISSSLVETSHTSVVSSPGKSGGETPIQKESSVFDGKGGLDSQDEDNIFLMVTNSQMVAKANALVRRKRPAEEARPTRFELEEDSEGNSNSSWAASSPLPSFLPSTPTSGQLSNASSNSLFISTRSQGTPENNCNQGALNDTSFNQEGSDSSAIESFKQILETVDKNKTSPENKTTSVKNDTSVGDKLSEDSADSKDSQDSGDSYYSGRGPEGKCSMPGHEVLVCQPVGISPPKRSRLEISSCKTVAKKSYCPDAVPKKPILKRKSSQDTLDSSPKKRVSFPLNESNEIVNEVATFSLAKEPSNSFISVQHIVGSGRNKNSNFKDSRTKLSRRGSLGKEVVISLDGNNEMLGSLMSGHGSNQGVTPGDVNNHTKIISEVLKKYPHLVKDKKNIKLKILKKENYKKITSDKSKLVQSKVQYLVVREGDSRSSGGPKILQSVSTPVKGDNVKVTTKVVQSKRFFKCPECEGEDSTFQTYFGFKKHVNTEHLNKASAILDSVECVPYACYSCFVKEPLEFYDYSSYQQHMKEVHSKNEARLCSVCGFRPGRKLELIYHQYTEHSIGPPRNISFPKCDLCEHVAMTESALLKHRSRHANSDNYTCSACGVAFRTFGALQGHMQTKLCQNKRSTNHKCPHCSLTFAKSYNLKSHIKSLHRPVQVTIESSNVSQAKENTNGTEEAGSSTSYSTHGESAGESSSGLLDNKGNIQKDGSSGALCEGLSGVEVHSSSEAEALSRAASNLAASLGLTDDVNQYMYTQNTKGDYTDSGEKDKFLACGGNRLMTEGTQVQFMDTNHASYSGDLPLNQTAAAYQAQPAVPVASSGGVGAMYSVGIVQGQIVPGQVFSGPVMSSQMVSAPTVVQSQMVPGGMMPGQLVSNQCVSLGGGTNTVLGPHQNWAFVAYQMSPASGSQGGGNGPTGDMTGVTSDEATVLTEVTTSVMNNTDASSASVMTESNPSLGLISGATIGTPSSSSSNSSTSGSTLGVGVEGSRDGDTLVLMTNAVSQVEVDTSAVASAQPYNSSYTTHFVGT
ncbi:uncharacterized protein LOC143020889 [Oratosquilla oratoria]|uniref:uncharacterized protein LOC143020889 n=1 Tax=Oratosquilla oratoria TaxID=337810 RepID=UPI003F768654